MEFGTTVARRLKPSGATAVCTAKLAVCTAKLAVLHGSSTIWFQTSRYCRANVEFNSINLVRHGSSTTFETGLEQANWEQRLSELAIR